MLNNEQWKDREKELLELKKQRKEISKKIHELQNALNQHGKHSVQKVRTDTACYKMFGKSLNELTKEEYKQYYNARQRINRQKRKEKLLKTSK